jgi:predicted molibdopterin-dependent oxidoreductase YjgC
MSYQSTLTTCPYCGCGCQFYLESINGRLFRTTPSDTSPVNRGKLCVKGWNVHQFVQSPKRLKEPMIRKNGELTPVSWDEALDFAAGRLRDIRDQHGPRSIGFFASAKVSNEENYLIQKFARAAVGTNSIDHCARL